VKHTSILTDTDASLSIPAQAMHVVAETTELQIEPQVGARTIHKLDAQTPVTFLRSEQGWVLVARDGKLLGYVPQSHLAPIH